MRHHHYGFSPFPVNGTQQFQYTLAGFTVQITDGFISKNDVRVIDQSPGYGTALLLTA